MRRKGIKDNSLLSAAEDKMVWTMYLLGSKKKECEALKFMIKGENLNSVKLYSIEDGWETVHSTSISKMEDAELSIIYTPNRSILEKDTLKVSVFPDSELALDEKIAVLIYNKGKVQIKSKERNQATGKEISKSYEFLNDIMMCFDTDGISIKYNEI